MNGNALLVKAFAAKLCQPRSSFPTICPECGAASLLDAAPASTNRRIMRRRQLTLLVNGSGSCFQVRYTDSGYKEA
jgi:hypothetical protein